MLPTTYIECTTLLFRPLPKQNAQDTVNSKPCFRQAVHFAKSQFFLYLAIQLAVRVELVKQESRTETFALCKVFKHRTSCLVPMSSAKIFLHKTCAGYNTLQHAKNEYHPHQEPQGTEGFEVGERAAEQLATQPVCPPKKSSYHREINRKSQDQAS